ncbi:MAG: RagB/SusD family nutrient uptake outer membrane protein [Butyricimonas paravirosa]
MPYLGRFEYERIETKICINIWKTSYLAISYLNNIINNLESKSEKDFRHYNLYTGEALGLRAVIHFDLLRFCRTRDFYR